MIIIGFSRKTSKLFPKLFCRKYKHCAPILINKNNEYIMLQFIKKNHIKKIILTLDSLKLLRNAGWEFINIYNIKSYNYKKSKTCVDLTKKVIGLYAPFIQTPYKLYKKLKRL